MFLKFTTKLQTVIAYERANLVLWLIFFFCLGSFFCILFFPRLAPLQAILTFLILFYCGFLSRKNRIFLIITAFFLGFSFCFISQKISNNYTKITGKIFVDIKASVTDIKTFHNSVNHQDGLTLTLTNLELTKSKFTPKPQKTKKKPSSVRKSSLMNIDGLQEIDYEFSMAKNNYQNVDWIERDGVFYYPKPPKKVKIFATKFPQDLQIGDEIFVKSVLTPFKKADFVGAFDFSFNAMTKGVAAQGYGLSQIEILQKNSSNFSFDYLKKLRKKIEEKIDVALPNQEGAIIKALLIGERKGIEQAQMQAIRHSGLAHLIAISGLHLSLSAAIFFFVARFLLLNNSYLALHFDIKKIAAILAICGSFFYLQIAGAPISAQRAFIMVCIAMAAIFFDRKMDLKRTVFFAGFFVVLLNPYNLFSISFQLSFSAVLGIVVFHEIWQNFCDKIMPNQAQKKWQKFLRYFLEMILISMVAQIANMAFLIYHFGDVALYGILSNLVAIPLTSFIVMPLGFVSFLLMPFGLEKIALIPMSYGIVIIEQTANFVSGLKNSYYYFAQMPKEALAISALSFLFFALLRTKFLRICALVIFFASFLSLKFVQQPQILIDGNASFFALYDDENGLVFSKKIRASKKRKLWMEKMQENEFRNFVDYGSVWLTKKGVDCQKEFCEIDLARYFSDKKRGKMLVLLKRNKLTKICGKKFEVVVNLTKKYKTPNCVLGGENLLIGNFELLDGGAHFLYLEGDDIEVESVEEVE